VTDHDFLEEEPTKPGAESMGQIMQSMEDETVRSPGIPTHTSERPTKPIRPMVHNNYDR
jgi:hypothetical protein